MKLLKIYEYDEKTLEYVGESEAYESPLEPGVFLFPANTTDAKPPKAGKNEVLCWNKSLNEWTVKPDFRGTTIYHKVTKEPYVIDKLGKLEGFINYTPQKPEMFHKWDANKNMWIIDQKLKSKIETENNINNLMIELNKKINKLETLDKYIPRGLEDTWEAIDFDISVLPQIQQDRLAEKQLLRIDIVEINNKINELKKLIEEN